MDTSQPDNTNALPPEPKPGYDAPGVAPEGTVGGPEVPKDARTMAMLAHLLGAFFCFLGPLLIWLLKKDEDRFIDQEGKEALNFQITMAIGYVASTVIWIIISFVTCGFGAILPVPLIVTIAQVVFGVIAAVAANKGEPYRYPFTLRLIT